MDLWSPFGQRRAAYPRLLCVHKDSGSFSLTLMSLWPIERTERINSRCLYYIFIGCNSIGGHITAAFCFLSAETEPDYYRALYCVQRLLYNPIESKTKGFLSDNEQALRSASGSIWLDLPKLLCLWHINKNVQYHFQKHIRQAVAPFDPGEEE